MYGRGYLEKMVLVGCILFPTASVSAETTGRAFTASISSTGKIIKQSPEWIANVHYGVQPGYFAEYKIAFKPGLFQRAPGYCNATQIDFESYEDVFYGAVRLGGSATNRHVNVLSHKANPNNSQAHPAQSFMLICVE
ncbi:hypothetical protein D3C76_757920 [compost metagenome]